MDSIKLINNDCIEELKKFKDNSIDCVITDPPYNISQNEKDLIRKTLNSPSFRRETSIKLDFGTWDKMEEKEFLVFTELWFKEIVRIMKPKSWCFIFFSKERIGYFTDPINGLFVNNGFKTRTVISWHKTNPTPSFRKMNFLSSCEFCIVGSKGEGRIPNFLNQTEMHNFFETSNKSSYGFSEHPTEKPKELIDWLVKLGSKENNLILDPFAGSGVTGLSCYDYDRNCILIEKDKEYFDMVCKVIDNKKKRERKLPF